MATKRLPELQAAPSHYSIQTLWWGCFFPLRLLLFTKKTICQKPHHTLHSFCEARITSCAHASANSSARGRGNHGWFGPSTPLPGGRYHLPRRTSPHGGQKKCKFCYKRGGNSPEKHFIILSSQEGTSPWDFSSPLSRDSLPRTRMVPQAGQCSSVVLKLECVQESPRRLAKGRTRGKLELDPESI